MARSATHLTRRSPGPGDHREEHPQVLARPPPPSALAKQLAQAVDIAGGRIHVDPRLGPDADDPAAVELVVLLRRVARMTQRSVSSSRTGRGAGDSGQWYGRSSGVAVVSNTAR
ncbi:hypothetical protein [Gordonia paraffinivorans]|uniref:hypothetical protein n=1 Tax=Gordonia paraffinivorans TaxID=175628 RepID=UPI0014472009|nr:hypothetical protein [Gordonia paraffinivorans]